MKHRKLPLLLLTGLTVGFAAHAGEPPADNSDAAYSAGMKAAIDPATGKLRQPTAAEMRSLQLKAAQTRPTRGALMPRNEAEAQRTLRKVPGGGYQIDVPEDRMSTLVATVQPDGSVRIEHADGPQAPTSKIEEADHE